ncbi:hypothetical protein [Frigoribacterium sp. 9N]|uniref:hypothetical protein n=1 Tax=Frigoribacterium sp. 9N TaxID=2653144 RepID=UPI0012EF90DE|nr:hypothetical protein [Frigoribacterium sp. 9N]VXB01211.1 conserved membrane hypothetical protein [Frigoribacterium sp. 9N]
MIVVLAGAVAAALVAFVGGLLLPADRRRGAALVVAFAVLISTTSGSAPDIVRHAAVAAVAGVSVAALVSPRSWSIGRPRATLATTAFFAFSIVCVLALAPSTIVLMAELAAIGVAISWLVSTSSSRDLRVFVRGLVVLGLAQVVVGVVELTITHRPIPFGYKVLATGRSFVSDNKILPGGLVRVEGTLGHPIPYAVFLAVCLVLVLVARRTFPVWFPPFAVLVLSAGILLSGSRSVVAAVLLAVTYVLMTSEARSRAAKIVLTVLGAVAGAAALASEIVDAVGTLVASGSYENRMGAVRSVPGLLARPALEALAGSGFGSEAELYARGLLPQEGFTVVDNQLVTTLATFGIAGIVSLVAALVVGFVHASRTGRAVLVVMIVTLFSFDYFVWFSTSAILWAFCALQDRPGDDRAALDPSGAHPSGSHRGRDDRGRDDRGRDDRVLGDASDRPGVVGGTLTAAR